MSSESKRAPTQWIELHVPLFTGKAGLGDNKKGDIYCSLQQCVMLPAKSQLRWAEELVS